MAVHRNIDPYRNNLAYKECRRLVTLRDKNRCRIPGCKYRGKKLEMHHISTFAGTINLRYEPKNCLLLCKSHHRMVTGKESYYAPMLNSIVNGEYDK